MGHVEAMMVAPRRKVAPESVMASLILALTLLTVVFVLAFSGLPLTVLEGGDIAAIVIILMGLGLYAILPQLADFIKWHS